MLSLPNSFAKLWDSALVPNLAAANADVVTLPLKLAVAPVNIKVPLFPFSESISFCLKLRIDSRAKANPATTFVFSVS